MVFFIRIGRYDVIQFRWVNFVRAFSLSSTRFGEFTCSAWVKHPGKMLGVRCLSDRSGCSALSEKLADWFTVFF